MCSLNVDLVLKLELLPQVLACEGARPVQSWICGDSVVRLVRRVRLVPHGV